MFGILLLLLSLLLTAPPAFADRGGWNEPPREPGYGSRGLLKINRDFFDLAASTGGDFYFWAPGEFAASAGLLAVPVASDPITLAYGSGSEDFVQSFEVPVDASISRISLFVGAQRLDELRLLRPDGRSIEANPAGVAVQAFRHMSIVTVVDPEPGRWRVEVRGAGNYSIAVRYLAGRKKLEGLDMEAIDLIDFAFVELKGRPGHEGFFPVTGPVRAGERRLCRITMSGEIRGSVLDMVSATGEVLEDIRVEETVSGGDEFIGTCRVPAESFRVRVRGEDREGTPFQRVTAGIISPEAAR